MDAPHVTELDALGAGQIARLEALIESIEDTIAERGLLGRGGHVRAFADLYLRWLGVGLLLGGLGVGTLANVLSVTAL